MAEGRMLKKRISLSKQMAELVQSVSSRLDPEHGAYSALVFTWMIAHADCEGRMHGDPDLVKQTICPRLSRVNAEHVAVYLRSMAECGLIHWYAARSDQWIALPGFERAQTGLRKEREAASLCPSPVEGTPLAARSRSGGGPEPTPELLRSYSGVDDGVTPPSVPQKGSEEKGREANPRECASDWRSGLQQRWLDVVGSGAGFAVDGLSEFADRCEAAATLDDRRPLDVFTQMVGGYKAYRDTCTPRYRPSLTPRKLLEHWATVWERINKPLTDDDADDPQAGERAAIDELSERIAARERAEYGIG